MLVTSGINLACFAKSLFICFQPNKIQKRDYNTFFNNIIFIQNQLSIIFISGSKSEWKTGRRGGGIGLRDVKIAPYELCWASSEQSVQFAAVTPRHSGYSLHRSSYYPRFPALLYPYNQVWIPSGIGSSLQVSKYFYFSSKTNFLKILMPALES